MLRNVDTGELRYYHPSQGSTDGLLEHWGLNSWSLLRTIGWSRGCRSLHRWSLLGLWSFVQSTVTEHVFSSIKILTTNGTGNRVAVGLLETGIKILNCLPQNIAYVSILSFQKYVCVKCGKQFTEKRSLTRHMKTHVDSSTAYHFWKGGRCHLM
jgi:hypothetical protein